jgi:protein-S-isoprenylcysteine O-methyltransferase Ste14
VLSAGLALETIAGPSTSDTEAMLYFCVHLLSAMLFLIREPPLERSTNGLSYIVASLSALYVYGYDFDVFSESRWFSVGKSLMIGGALLCVFATLSLGRYFGVLPICRGVQTGRLYKIVRHPIYASYILMDIGLIIAYPTAGNATFFLLGLTLFVRRIRYEEMLLQRFESYRKYMARVKFRLLPFVY